MPATPGKKDQLARPCVFAMEPPAVRVHDGAPGCACSRWSPAVVPAVVRAVAAAAAAPAGLLALAVAAPPCRSPRGKGAKGKSRAKASRRRVAAAKAAPKLKAVLSEFWAIFHAGNSHFRANRGGAARCGQPGVRLASVLRPLAHAARRAFFGSPSAERAN